MVISSVFLNNKTQAVRLPASVRLEKSTKKVFIRIVGKDRVISPCDSSWDSFFYNSAKVSDDFLTKRAQQFQSKRDSFDD